MGWFGRALRGRLQGNIIRSDDVFRRELSYKVQVGTSDWVPSLATPAGQPAGFFRALRDPSATPLGRSTSRPPPPPESCNAGHLLALIVVV
jgi:hypothetical protein